MFRITKNIQFIFLLVLALCITSLSSCAKNEINSQKLISNQKQLLKVSDDTLRQIESVIFDKYLLGQKMKSAKIIRSAFNKDSVMLFPVLQKDGKFGLTRWLDMHKIAADWADQSSSDLDLSQFEILSIDVVDERIAVVTLKVKERVYDALTLVKEADDWKIASKVYILQKS